MNRSADHSHDETASGGERTAAVALWALVGAGLLYGVAETAVKAAALFG